MYDFLLRSLWRLRFNCRNTWEGKGLRMTSYLRYKRMVV